MKNATLSTVLLVAANVLVPLSMVIFATGFFPYKPFLPGLAQYHDIGNRPLPEPPFNKVVFMVVDALRSDFVYAPNSGFGFVHQLIREGAALPYTSNAQSPTVTMPRVKALTTGSIPTFLDLVLNIAESDTSSSLATQDTWLAQMAAKKTGKITMWGDDTWLKLFPDFFDRADGTSSFFVSDFTEVDNNVTRHIPDELRKDDWSVMVMHYLGMDHIGHKSGPHSVNMLPKQLEMNDVVRDIYQAQAQQPHLQDTLLVLLGDHGMNDGGNHGGSTPGETSPAMVFMSPKLKLAKGKPTTGKNAPVVASEDYDFYDKIEQSDVAPTLAALLGFPVPLNNLGVMIPAFADLWPKAEDWIQLLLRNALQLLNIVKATFPHSYWTDTSTVLDCVNAETTAEDLACAWKQVVDGLPKQATDAYESSLLLAPLYNFCKKAQAKLSSTASNYDAGRLFAGIAACGVAVVITLVTISSSLSLRLSSSSLWTVATSVAYVVMMFASSYVEEEQQFWHWAAIAWAVLPHGPITLDSAQASLVTAVCFRIMRRWNQSGQKFSGAPDIATDFLPRNPETLLILNVVTFWFAGEDLAKRSLVANGVPSFMARPAGYLVSASAVVFKLAFTFNDAPELFGDGVVAWKPYLDMLPSLVTLARVAFLLDGLVFAFDVFSHLTKPSPLTKSHQPSRILPTLLASSHAPLRILLLLQSRAINIPLFLLLAIIISRLPLMNITSAPQHALASLILSHAAFFALGGTNAIGSVDLSQAYNGVSSYAIAVTGVLCLLSNFAGPFAAGHALASPPHTLLRGQRGAWRREYLAHVTFFMASMVFGVMAACTVLRTHLFVWTVFSPKFLYAAAWFLGWHLLWNIGVVGLLSMAG